MTDLNRQRDEFKQEKWHKTWSEGPILLFLQIESFYQTNPQTI